VEYLLWSKYSESIYSGVLTGAHTSTGGLRLDYRERVRLHCVHCDDVSEALEENKNVDRWSTFLCRYTAFFRERKLIEAALVGPLKIIEYTDTILKH